MKKTLILLFAGLLILIPLIGSAKEKPKTITAFCGSASKPATKEAAKAFEKKTGIKVYLNFSGSGTMLSQLKIAREGDLYIPGSPDYMRKAERENVIDPSSVQIISYLIPVIIVQEGNPKNIRSLSDLARPGIEVGIGDPQTVVIGDYAYQILEGAGLIEDVCAAGTIVTHAASGAKTVGLVVLKSVDAVIGFRVFSEWNPDSTDIVYITPEQIKRISYIPGAISTFTKDRDSALKFLNFLTSPEGRKIFAKWGYIASESDARKFAPNAEIGGEYRLPKDYKPLVK